MSELNWHHTPLDSLSAADLNRIETHTQALSGILLGYGYSAPVTVKTDWTQTDFLTPQELSRIRHNINALQAGFYSLPDWRELERQFGPDGRETLDSEQVNAKEWDLHSLYVWTERMAAAFLYAGEIYAGEVW